jgi:DNA-binding FrmR family transcriptional regulator
MRNKELAQKRVERIAGKLKTIRVMITRQGVTTQDLNEVVDAIENELNDLQTMIQREGEVYGR